MLTTSSATYQYNFWRDVSIEAAVIIQFSNFEDSVQALVLAI